MTTPILGDFGVVTHGRTFTEAVIEKVTGSDAYHAFMFVGPQTWGTHTDEPAVMEARPSGAGLALVSHYPGAVWSTGAIQLPEGQRLYNVAAALAMSGTRYGWLNCFCIGLVRLLHWHAPKWALRVLKSRRWAECAQLVDMAWTDGAQAYNKLFALPGSHLFADMRPEGLVAPGELYDLIKAPGR